MGDLWGTVSGTVLGKPPQFPMGSEGVLNSGAIGRKFGDADVYDVSAISLTPDKISGSR